MNYKLIKIGYLSIAFVILALYILGFLFPDVISMYLLFIISLSLLVPFFALRVLYEDKYPPTRTQKNIGVVIVSLGMLIVFFIWLYFINNE